jgi:hypothetical protein
MYTGLFCAAFCNYVRLVRIWSASSLRLSKCAPVCHVDINELSKMFCVNSYQRRVWIRNPNDLFVGVSLSERGLFSCIDFGSQ